MKRQKTQKDLQYLKGTTWKLTLRLPEAERKPMYYRQNVKINKQVTTILQQTTKQRT